MFHEILLFQDHKIFILWGSCRAPGTLTPGHVAPNEIKPCEGGTDVVWESMSVPLEREKEDKIEEQ